MLFTSTPENLASYFRPLIYEFADEEAPRTLDFFIRDGLTDELIAVKRLCDTSAGKVDIAPILRSRLDVRPLLTPGFASASGRALCVRTTVEDTTRIRWFLPAETDPDGSALIGTMPLERTIGCGECDELTLEPDTLRVEIEIESPPGTSVKNYLNFSSGDPSLFRLDTTELPAGFTRLALSFYDSDGAVRAQVRYAAVSRPEGAVRVAWFSRRGSLEHYTFPVANLLAEAQEREDIALCDGRRMRVRAPHRTMLTLTSAYERPELLRALCEIGTSPAVWVIDPQGRYLEAEAGAEERTIARPGALSALSFTFKIDAPWS